MGIMNKKLIKYALMIMAALTMNACSTVRDTTDWIPGVDSNEEIKAQEKKEAMEAAEKESETYKDKVVFAPTAGTALTSSTLDAQISVNIGQQYAEADDINREDVGIEVNAGVVTLTGNVDSNESAVNVISIAKSTAGVSRVISKLVVIKVRESVQVPPASAQTPGK